MLDPVARHADESFERGFPRIHPLALGVAVGVTTGGALFLLTAFHLFFRPPDGLTLELLSQYFWLYDVTWIGALAGLVWGFVTGLVGGWLLGFIHNLTIATWLIVVRAKSELSQRRNILDHLR